MPQFRSALLCLTALACSAGLLFAETPAVPLDLNAVPEGKTVLIRLGQALQTRTARQGHNFKASLAEDLIAPNGFAIPRGSRVRGHISRVSQGMHPRLLLSFDDIETTRGRLPLLATVTGVPGEHGLKQPDGDGAIEVGSRETGSIDEPKSPWSRITSVAGFFSDRSVRLQKGTVMELRLDRALQIPRR